MLTLNQLTHSYAQPTQSRQAEHTRLTFDLDVEAGDIVALIGPSGAGKSTLLAMVAGFLPPDSGTLTIADQTINRQLPSERPLSLLFQDHNLFPHLSVFENIGLGLHPGLRLSREDKENIVVAASRVGIQKYLDRLPEQLSGGQKQRVALARCLIRKRPLLLLDEPFSALDPALRKEMLELVKSLAKEHQTTVLMVTHSPEDALKIAGNCAFICDGKIRVFGETKQMLTQPEDEALKKYLGV
ncbi:thiamine ABC transporter ATP-binding protein [Photobacterium chitinilyticum]|uniref:Thiamine ABC transporter ATP-binding protein n=1 Tax=Photobacterium chitinilyticum TaxID=2485123 RepID=A0A3S3R7C9_9GAMM|nr:thiamine ABC transporter ATP-binding protein [Photobacterium chitinilyticum]RWX54030.1 thiamine ABC transporter ATP-binding protein [Photobacterium chitinilyticum]